MKLSRNGLLTRFYKRTFFVRDNELTPNFCVYFWTLVAALVALPLTWWTYRFEDTDERDSPIDDFASRMGLGFVVQLLTLLLVSLLVLIVKGFVDYPVLMTTLTVLLGGVLFIVIARARGNNFVTKVTSEVYHVAETRVEAVKENYCPRIEWQ